MDGLLIDSEPLWKRAEQEVFATLGIQLTDDACEQTLGLRTDMVVAHWYQRFPWESPSQRTVADAVDQRVEELVALHGQAMPGAIRAIEATGRAGLLIGLATSSSHSLIHTVVCKLDLAQYFTVTCSAMDEEFGKPHPAVYQAVAAKLGVAPPDCVAFEDTVPGVQSAKAAGMRVIAVPAAHNFDDPGFDTADLKLRSLEGMRIQSRVPQALVNPSRSLGSPDTR
jgi:sugar-phosphatase